MVLYLSCSQAKRSEKTSRDIKKELGVEAYTWKSYSTKLKKKMRKNFQMRFIRHKKEKNGHLIYFIIPDVGDMNYSKYYTSQKNFFGYGKCPAPFIMVDIMPNGDVVTCRDFSKSRLET
jgi:hypothetical protein